MTSEDDLIELLVTQEIIISGLHDIDEIKQTPHYKILRQLIDGPVSIEQLHQHLPNENISIILFELIGDGLIIKDDKNIRFHDRLKK